MKYANFLLLTSIFLAAQPAHSMQYFNKLLSNQTQRFLDKSMQEWFTHIGVVRINQQSVKALSQQPMPTFKSQPTPWECYKMHKESFKKIDKNHL